MKKRNLPYHNSAVRWYDTLINSTVAAASMFPISFLEFLQRRLEKRKIFRHFLQCAITYKYYKMVCKHCKESSALFYYVEAPELSKITGLTEKQSDILDRKMSTSELLDDTSYLEKAYCGNVRCLAFAKDRFRGTRLYSNGRYVKPADCSGKYYHVVNGIRYTPASRGNAPYRIRLFGSCIARGYGVSDEYTIANFLQETWNEKHPGMVDVINHGTGGATGYDGIVNDLKYILDTATDSTEAIVLITYHTFLERLIRKRQKGRYLECSPLFSDGNVTSWWFLNSVVHLNHVGNQVIAEKLYQELEPVLQQFWKEAPATLQKTIAVSEEEKQILQPGKAVPGRKEERYRQIDQDLPPELASELKDYLEHLSCVKAGAFKGKTGAIVMNCNPFTLGHQYLIEQARNQVDQLYIFVVEEDRSDFRFADRLAMVRQGVIGISNVIVIPSGRFIISALTFPEYFQKEERQEAAIEAAGDIEIFGKYIAPALDITIRFAGEEPLDAVTAQYNNLMAGELGRYGIDFCCIKRRKLDGQYISATRVRKLLREGNLEEAKRYLPESTAAFLEKYKK